MDAGSTAGISVIEWAVASRALGGAPVSGDCHLVVARPDGALVAVVDGLGHGAEAATAAEIAVATLSAHAHEPAIQLVERCHDRLRGSRGVVMSLATFDTPGNTLTWLG